MQPQINYSQLQFRAYPDENDGNTMLHLNTDNTVYLTPEQLFIDPEDDVMTFVSAKSDKPSLVSASITNDELLAIHFTARGSATITITLKDETDKAYSYTLIVTNTDLEAPSMWTRLLVSFESNKLVWVIILCCIALAVIILIVVIAVARKRKRAREELEALLVSEMAIEEQMLRLAGGPLPTGYSSYGYLQSAPGTTVDPSLMLGAGEQAPLQDMGLALPPSQVDTQGVQSTDAQPSLDDTNPYGEE